MTAAALAERLGVDLHVDPAPVRENRHTNARVSYVGAQKLDRWVTVYGVPIRKGQRVWVSQRGPGGVRIHLDASHRGGVWCEDPHAVVMLENYA